MTLLRRHRGRRLRARAFAGALLALGLLSLALASNGPGAGARPLATSRPATASATVGCQSQFGSFSVGKWPPACWRPYGPRSPFNRPIPASPRLSGESGAIVSYIGSQGWAFPHQGANFSMTAFGSRPVYWSNASDPLVTVVCRPEHFTCRRMSLHIPAGARPQEESDGHLAVIDQALHREFDLWRAGTPSNGTILAGSAGSIPIGPNGGMGRGGDAEAADLGLAGGLIRAPELAAGRIEHALAITAECVQPHDVWPAPSTGRGDAVCDGGRSGPHLGSLLQLNMSDPQIAATRAPAWQQAIMRAMSHYGMYVVDTNGAGNTELALIKEDDTSFTSFGYEGQTSAFVHSLGGHGHLTGVPIDASRLRVIAPCVPRGTC
jgi:hypothetical protein